MRTWRSRYPKTSSLVFHPEPASGQTRASRPCERRTCRCCNQEFWVNRSDNLRLFGPVRKDSAEWKDLYALRQAIERTFKSMKESRRLERHCLRGLRKVSLHAAMSILGYAATCLVNLLAKEPRPHWMVRKVA